LAIGNALPRPCSALQSNNERNRILFGGLLDGRNVPGANGTLTRNASFSTSPTVNSRNRRVRITAGLLTRSVQIPQQAPFARQELYTGQEPLQALEVDLAFRCDQFLFPFLPCTVPPLRDPGCAVGCVGCADLAKPCSRHESFILSRRAVHVKADGAARGDFFVGKHPADYQSVTEQHPSARLQHPKDLTQDLGPPWKMAQNVIRKHSVKGLVVEREIL
jgi:hypothetical protein